MRTALLLLLALVSYAADLRIYAIDTEGGKSTLYISPSGESLLIDAGYEGERDLNRIQAAMQSAGVDQIDHFVLTHYHNDHSGGVKQLAAKVRIGRFYDHGPSLEAGLDGTWLQVAKARTTLRAGDKIGIRGMDVTVVAAAGQLISRPGTTDVSCAPAARPGVDKSENSQSLALTISYGKFRVTDLGDLSPDHEFDLACAANRVGHADLYMTTHHGTGASVPAQILDAVAPRAVIMNNGATKGGSVKALENLQARRESTDLWQLHYSNAGGEKLNTPEPFIANMAEPCQGKGIVVTAAADGSFTVENLRNSLRKKYPAIN